MRAKKHIFNTILMLLLLIFAGCGHLQNPVADNTQITHEGMYVDGTKLCLQDGTDFIMRGINMAHCWYKAEDDVSLKAIADTGANCVRVVLSNGARWDIDNAEDVADIIDKARSYGMIIILEVHDGTGSDNVNDLVDIAKYWCGLSEVLKGTESDVIVNIANEWCKSYSASKWAQGYEQVIPMLRDAGIKNVIMVDAGGYGQNGGSIHKRGADVFNADPMANTMFSIHMYGTSGKNEHTIVKNLLGATELNLCICVGEFGYTHSDGDVDEEFLMKYCTENSIGFLPWSWKGNSGGVEYLDLALEWDGSVLSPEWGEKLVNSTYWNISK